MHAQLINKLEAAGVDVIGYDVMFAENSNAQDDGALSAAVAASGRVVFPVVNEQVRSGGQLREILPISIVAEGAAALGHVDHPIDQDAVSRSVYLRAGLGDPRWPSFAVAVLGIVMPDTEFSSGGDIRRAPETASPFSWQREDQLWTAFAGPPGHFPRISFRDILAGDFPLAELQGRIALVGATAIGLGDVLPTPVSGNNQPMPGVEIIANEIDTLKNGLGITPLSLPWLMLFTLVTVIAFTQLLPRLAVRYSLGLMIAGVLGTLVLSVIALKMGRWFPPMSAVVGITSGYVFWSWHRLNLTVKHLNRSLDELNSTRTIVETPFSSDSRLDAAAAEELFEQVLSPDSDATAMQHLQSDTAGFRSREGTPSTVRSPVERLERHIQLVEDATHRIRDISEFVHSSLSQMTNGILVADNMGQIKLINQAALRLFDEPDDRDTTEDSIRHYWNKLTFSPRNAALDCLRKCMVEGTPVNIEASGPGGRDLLLKLVPFRMGGSAQGIVVDIDNVTSIRVNENRRREFLRFLSHDLRSPLASIISAAQLSKLERDENSDSGIATRIEGNARKALKLADEFLDLINVGGVTAASFERIEIGGVIDRAIATISDHAHGKSISVSKLYDKPLYVMGEPNLLERMFTNLLINAVKYSPTGAKINIRTDKVGRNVRCRIIDTGHGIAEDDATMLFTRFKRIERKEHQEEQGSGIGLVFAKTVVDQHQGTIAVDSKLNIGTTFTILIPGDD